MNSLPTSKGYFTQWAAQFYVAAELARRGYQVTLTLGMAPMRDLLVVSPSGRHFSVEVKGLRRPNWWIIGKPKTDVYYVLTYIPEKTDQPPEFFIMTIKEVEEEENRHIEDLKKRGREVTELEYGFTWKVVFKYRNHWNILPS